MLGTRVMPCLLLDGEGLYKTVRFKDPKYVGDPINAVRIFNERFVDEIVFLDISASRTHRGPNYEAVAAIAEECFIPLCYGGGVSSVDQARRLFGLGVEKISLNTAAVQRPELIGEMASTFGSQSVIVAMDVGRNWTGRSQVRLQNGRRNTGLEPVSWARRAVDLGAGELLVNSVDRDGTGKGFDLKVLAAVTSAVDVPVIACGGAGTLEHLSDAVLEAGVAAVAAGSLFVFKGKHRAVLINYPSQAELRELPGIGLSR